MPPVRRPVAVILALALALSACATSSTPAPPASAGATSTPAPSGTPTAAPGSACTPATTPAAQDWNQRVWYEVFVRSFADGNGDGIGDLRGLTAKLDYLNDGNPATSSDLGVTGLWLMPIMESPSYHGYDVIDYRQVEHDYGTSADFKALLAAAHQRGIKVIVDLVLNHTSSESPWFIDAQKPGSVHDGWYVWTPSDPGTFGADGHAVWYPAGGRWFYSAFSSGMPDLNYRNPAVTAAMTDVARFWLQDMGVDGFRLDAAKYLIEDPKQLVNTPETLAWLKDFHASVQAAKPGSFMVGEVWDTATVAGKYVPGSIDSTFNFPLAAGTISALQGGSAALLNTALGDTLTAWPPNQGSTFLTNHDQNRVMSQLNGDVPAAKLAAFILMTEPGVPFVYYGEEIGLQGSKPDEQIRTPMPWTGAAAAGGFTTGTPWEPLSDGWQTANVAAEASDPASMLSAYRNVIAMRTANAALRVGGTTLLADSGADPVTGWLRTTADQALLTLVNVSDKPVSTYALKLASGPLCGPRTARIVATVGGDAAATVAAPTVTIKGGFAGYQPLSVLPPRSGYVIALEPAP